MDGLTFAERLTELRLLKGVSARDMSLALKQNHNYINAIENNKNLPSMKNFFAICDYLGITPSEFFAVKVKAPDKVKKLTDVVERLPANDIDLLINLVKEFR